MESFNVSQTIRVNLENIERFNLMFLVIKFSIARKKLNLISEFCFNFIFYIQHEMIS